jgi:hypothetical protein
MKILRSIASRNGRAVLWLCVAAFSQMAAAQVWIASTGMVDESSISTYQFNDQAAFVRSSVATGTTLLRYNVVPAGDILKPITDPCCEARALMVRFLDNGSAARVIVRRISVSLAVTPFPAMPPRAEPPIKTSSPSGRMLTPTSPS